MSKLFVKQNLLRMCGKTYRLFPQLKSQFKVLLRAINSPTCICQYLVETFKSCDSVIIKNI